MTSCDHYDLAVVGGGPAGLAGAAEAASAGLAVALLDAGPRLGGQFYRHWPGREHPRLLRLRDALPRGVDVLTEHRVWSAERRPGGFAVHCLAGGRDERPAEIGARALLIATGAHDLVLPFPGWDLPGVMTAGGAQALLKGGLVLAGSRVAVAGTGPFLLPVAISLAEAGARVVGVFEAGRPLAAAGALLRGPGRLAEAAAYGMGLARHRIPYRTGHAVVAAHGDARVDRVTVARVDAAWRPVPGGPAAVECDALAVGYGFLPQLDLALQLGCRIVPGPAAYVDAGRRTSVPGVYAAGETTGVGGAVLAEAEGRIAGRAAAADLGRRVPPAPGLSRRADRLAAFARALRDAYPVRDGWRSWLTDDTLICRCEEVSHARVREALALGATDARSVKLLARPGMGWCQGRMCGYAVACLAGEDPASAVPRRPVAQPIRLRDLAEGPGAAPRGPSDQISDPPRKGTDPL
ncbi:Thioredoxin reductase [Sinosporangium album]|uniref:Thioredoxin reductase n=1 Tax=Sinosporangium album TaxID=504805 RepID=A0A1G7WJ33_9ACTN|nr:FAD/NAD(P)-binding oxidoreductase [Sinosporangium album]SDG71976.1 Thioredoxin reductase [Sinosporangium album]